MVSVSLKKRLVNDLTLSLPICGELVRTNKLSGREDRDRNRLGKRIFFARREVLHDSSEQQPSGGFTLTTATNKLLYLRYENIDDHIRASQVCVAQKISRDETRCLTCRQEFGLPETLIQASIFWLHSRLTKPVLMAEPRNSDVASRRSEHVGA